ncbi:hypothetical protein I6F11_17525 [Ensifer sp. NBAIM29]|nr:hypothetical protein [Ensifer sp. NBAIM29]
MMRTSHFLTMLLASLDQTASHGRSVPASLIPQISALLKFCASQCEEMELRLAGAEKALPPAGNVISFRAWMIARNRAPTPPSGGDAA